VTDNILKRHVECTCEEYVEHIAGKRSKPFLSALKTCFSTIVLGKSTLVKEMSSFLRTSETPLERKRVQELMSSWLVTYDFASLMNPHLLRAAEGVTDEDNVASQEDISSCARLRSSGVSDVLRKDDISFTSVDLPRTMVEKHVFKAERKGLLRLPAMCSTYSSHVHSTCLFSILSVTAFLSFGCYAPLIIAEPAKGRRSDSDGMAFGSLCEARRTDRR